MKKIILKSLFGATVFAFASSANAAVIFIDFTNSGTAAASPTDAFNHLNNSTTVATALKDSVGASTTATITRSGNLAGGNSTGATAVAGNASAAGFNQTAAQSYHFTTDANIAIYTIAGLEVGTSYKFTAFGSRNATDARPTEYKLTPTGGATQTLTAQPSGAVNNTAIQAFTAASSTNGTFTFTFQGTNTTGNQFGYLNALKIEAVPEPSSAMLLGSIGVLGLLRRRRA